MFLIRFHQFRSKYFVFAEGLASRVAQLLSCPQKHLKLSKRPSFFSNIEIADASLSGVEILPILLRHRQRG